MAGSSWPDLVAGRKARASDVEAKFDWLEGAIAPQSGGSVTTGVHDLGTSTAYWRALWGNSINPTTTANGIAVGTTTVVNNSDVALEIAGTKSVLLPRMTTVQRDLLTGINGMVVYNSTTNQFQIYENGAWRTMGGAAIGIVARVVVHVTGAATSTVLSFSGSGRAKSVSTVGNPNTGTSSIVIDSISTAEPGLTAGSMYWMDATALQTTTVLEATTAANDIDLFFKNQFKVFARSEGAGTTTVYAMYEGS